MKLLDLQGSSLGGQLSTAHCPPKDEKEKLHRRGSCSETKVFIENGDVRTILNENIQRNGYMDLEDARQLLHAIIDKLEELSHQ